MNGENMDAREYNDYLFVHGEQKLTSKTENFDVEFCTNTETGEFCVFVSSMKDYCKYKCFEFCWRDTAEFFSNPRLTDEQFKIVEKWANVENLKSVENWASCWAGCCTGCGDGNSELDCGLCPSCQR